MLKKVFECDDCGCDCCEHQDQPILIQVGVAALTEGLRRKDLDAIPFPRHLREIANAGVGKKDLCIQCACKVVGDGTVDPPTEEAIFRTMSARLMNDPTFMATDPESFRIDVDGLDVALNWRQAGDPGTEDDMTYSVAGSLETDNVERTADYDALATSLGEAALKLAGIS